MGESVVVSAETNGVETYYTYGRSCRMENW